MRRLFFIAFALCLYIAAPRLADAQNPTADEDCPAFVHEALTKLDTTCEGLGRNALCYGNTLVSVTFNQEVGTDVFTKPSDKAQLRDVELVETAPLDPSNEQWGLALMNVQANVPGTLPGQGVVFVLMGDAQVKNEVDGDDLTEGIEPIDVVAAADINIRSAPSLKANVLASGFNGVTFQADLRSPDGEWLRVRHNNLPVWIHRSGVFPVDGLDTLPNPTRTELSPMQSFQFTGGIGSSTCKQASGSLLIQGPDDVIVDLEANGARIRLASTILLTREDDTLTITTLSGAAKVGGVIVPAGFTTQATLNAENKVENKAFSPAKPVESLKSLEIFGDLPETTMNYQLDLNQAQSNQQVYTPEVLQDLDEGEFGFEEVDCDADPTHVECEVEDVDTNEAGSTDEVTTDPCSLNSTLPGCTPVDTATIEPCVTNSTLPQCITATNSATVEAGTATPDPCVLDASLPGCTPTIEVTVDPCANNASLPECNTTEEPIPVDPCAVDPSLPQCNPTQRVSVEAPTLDITPIDPCTVDPSLPQCNPTQGVSPIAPTVEANHSPTTDVCVSDPSLPQCNAQVATTHPCDTDSTLPECSATEEIQASPQV